MRGAIASLAVGTVAVAIGMSVGVALGASGGWIGGWLDEATMRVADAVSGFPAVLSALLITSVFGPGVLISMVAVGIAYVPIFARLDAGEASYRSGPRSPSWPRARWGPGRAILWRHVLPNTVSPLIVQATISFPWRSSRGGPVVPRARAQPPHPSWGLMLREAQNFLQLSLVRGLPRCRHRPRRSRLQSAR